MSAHLLRYRVRADAVAEHELALAELLDELAESPVEGLRYEVFRVAGERSYVHLIAFEKTNHGPPERPAALAVFHDGLRGRCEGSPTRENVEQLGSG